MADYKELCEELRSEYNIFHGERVAYRMENAADAIKELQAENERLKKERDAAVDCVKRSHIIGYADDNSPIYDIGLCQYCVKNTETACDCINDIGEKFVFGGFQMHEKEM